MHARGYQRKPKRGQDASADDGEDAASGAEGVEGVADADAQEVAERGERAEGNGRHDEHGEERGEDGSERVGQILLEELLDIAHDPDGEQDGHSGGAVYGGRAGDTEDAERRACVGQLDEGRGD